MFGCQPGKIDQIIIGMFANAQESPEAKQTILTQNATESVSISQQNYQGLEVPAYSDNDFILKRTTYTTSYDKVNKIPKWVAWHLISDHTNGDQRRLSNFIVDDEVPAPRAELVDYKGSGYDRGHMCPAGDNKWGFEPMKESFFLTNICPQGKSCSCSGNRNRMSGLRDFMNRRVIR